MYINCIIHGDLVYGTFVFVVKFGFAGDDLLPVIYELPLDLFDMLVARVPPLALQKLQIAMCVESYFRIFMELCCSLVDN